MALLIQRPQLQDSLQHCTVCATFCQAREIKACRELCACPAPGICEFQLSSFKLR